MIYTLTLNTAIDMNISCTSLQPSKVNRTEHTEYCPNGKGVNVALVLNHFRQPTHIFGIFGGFTGKYIVDEIANQKIAITPAWVNAPTRINVFINDGQQEYKLVNPGTWIDDDCKQQVVDNLNRLEAGDTLVISGSLPPGIESRFYAEILSLCKQKGCEVILDISHPVLRNLVEMQPLLIKPNNEELAEVFGLQVTNHQQAKEAMATLHQLGVRHVLLTLGSGGSYFSDGGELWFCTAPEIELISSACAGDAALAAFLSIWLNGGAVEDALRYANATGADVAGSAGLGSLSRIEELLTQVQVVKL